MTPTVTRTRQVSPGCYKILTEDDDWITGMLTMEVGEKDGHRHHMA